ncbi:hypothetical protein K9M78_07550 [Candidatus Bipolaricaulota bacterium]|nr:hypothetical protein [Candidatus Bipolaricaulota bacterium]
MALKIDKGKFLEALEGSTYGTGTLAETAGVDVSVVLGLIANEEGRPEEVKKVGEVLPGDWVRSPDQEKSEPGSIPDEEFEELSIDEVKELVDEDELTLSTVKSLELEKPAEEQRVTLLRWIEEKLSE